MGMLILALFIVAGGSLGYRSYRKRGENKALGAVIGATLGAAAAFAINLAIENIPSLKKYQTKLESRTKK